MERRPIQRVTVLTTSRSAASLTLCSVAPTWMLTNFNSGANEDDGILRLRLRLPGHATDGLQVSPPARELLRLL